MNNETDQRTSRRKILFHRYILLYRSIQTSDTDAEITFLQKQFHNFVLESFNEKEHDLALIYFNLIKINQNFIPAVATINKISHSIRFNKINSDIEQYSFVNEISYDFCNDELNKALTIFTNIFNAKAKDIHRTKEFHEWLDKLVEY